MESVRPRNVNQLAVNRNWCSSRKEWQLHALQERSRLAENDNADGESQPNPRTTKKPGPAVFPVPDRKPQNIQYSQVDHAGYMCLTHAKLDNPGSLADYAEIHGQQPPRNRYRQYEKALIRTPLGIGLENNQAQSKLNKNRENGGREAAYSAKT